MYKRYSHTVLYIRYINIYTFIITIIKKSLLLMIQSMCTAFV